jgi:hypothetical protein
MPRAGGIYSAPPGTTAAPNTTIESAKYNALVADLVDDANNARPVAAGGSGSTTAVGGNDNFNTYSSDMLSAATVNLANATGTIVNITGTVTITALGTVVAGAERVLIFAGILTLTHNASSLILPTGANITTAAGDVATMRSKGGGNWVCVGYQRANGKPLVVNADDTFTVTSTDAGATAGPVVDLYRDSASPADSDLLAVIQANGRDSAANKQLYASIQAILNDEGTGSEDGIWQFLTAVAGTVAARLNIGAGIYTEGVTGGDKGTGTVNADAYYAGGVRLTAAPDAVMEDQKASATDGGTFTQGAWQTRVLNTEVRDASSLVSIAANAFTPTVAGWVEWSAPARNVGAHKTRLFNVTDTTVAGVGSSEDASGSSDAVTRSVGGGPVVAGKAYRIEHQCASTTATVGFGQAVGFASTVEIYTRVNFWRTA